VAITGYFFLPIIMHVLVEFIRQVNRTKHRKIFFLFNYKSPRR
jgi:hypothetical protein